MTGRGRASQALAAGFRIVKSRETEEDRELSEAPDAGPLP
jgi:hypothetical protein